MNPIIKLFRKIALLGLVVILNALPLNAMADSLQVSPTNGFTAIGNAGGPFNINSQIILLTNTSASNISYQIGLSTNWLSVSTNQGTIAPFGINVVVFSLNSAATNLTNGTYTATAWFTNTSTQFIQTNTFTLIIGQQAVLNGDFETGDFTSWTLANSSSVEPNGRIHANNFVTNQVFGYTAYSGVYYAEMGQYFLPLATLTQQVPTFSGQIYALSFQLLNPSFGFGDNSTSNEFSVTWNGATIFDRTNVPVISTWTNFHFLVTSTGTTTPLQFGFQNFYSVFAFDAVTLTPVPPPTIRGISKLGTNAVISWSSGIGNIYQLQSTTNLRSPVAWTNVGTSITALATNTGAVDAIVTNTARFYRVALIQ